MAQADNDDLINVIEEDEKQETIPETMPLMPVRDVVIFTDMLLPLFVGRRQTVRAVEEAVSKDGFLMLATQKDPNSESPGPNDIYAMGTIGRVLKMLKLPDGRVKALVQGITKAKITGYVKVKPWYRVKVEVLKEERMQETDMETQAMMRAVRDISEKILTLRGEMNNEVKSVLDSIREPGKLADLVGSNLRLKLEESQKLLEILNPIDRLRKINHLLVRELEFSAVQAKIQSDVREEISKNQRDYFLREQVRAIHRELGDPDDKAQEIKEYEKKIKRAKMSRAAHEESHKQLKRLEQMHPESGESSIIRNYLDWLTDMPWKKSTKDVINIKEAKKILDDGHHGLDKIKDRILEYLSVRKLNPKTKGPILCFVGPPGVGKTSLGKAIAKAVKRKFVRISLGGVRDEAEIRGHRRTYLGALPGRILQGLKQCGVNNPVFMMDEIDKLSSDFRGDPSSALLEALDPEQNVEFSDHYLSLPFDLSKVMFILTANITDTIPSALRDRMEIIRLSGYTEEEKLTIAEKHLLPKQIKENGLKPKRTSLPSDVIVKIIREYTSESGLRNLERELANLCRKIARKIAEGQKGLFAITRSDLETYLGVSKFSPEMDQEESQTGLAT
ncbi:MAG: endopeptidase La, partial [Desulfobacteraceae bacterium IS3]